MGQLLDRDQRPQLPVQITHNNVQPVTQKQPLHICPVLSIGKGERIFFIESEEQLQGVYRFGLRYTVHIQLRKQEVKNVQGVYLKLSEDYVYAYKHRKLDRADKIKPQKLLFKKRIYENLIKTTITETQIIDRNENTKVPNHQIKETGSKLSKRQMLLLYFAQMKLMSLLQIGARLGRIHTQCDGILTPEYIEYYSQVTIDKISQSIAKNSELKQLQSRLEQKNMYYQGLLKNENLSYSRWRKGYVLKQEKFSQSINQRKNTSLQSTENQSIHYIIRMFETEVTRVIMDLDNEAKMLPFMNNLITHNNFDKSIMKIEESITTMQNQSDKLQNLKTISKVKSEKQLSYSQQQKQQQRPVSSSEKNRNQKQKKIQLIKEQKQVPRSESPTKLTPNDIKLRIKTSMLKRYKKMKPKDQEMRRNSQEGHEQLGDQIKKMNKKQRQTKQADMKTNEIQKSESQKYQSENKQIEELNNGHEVILESSTNLKNDQKYQKQKQVFSSKEQIKQNKLNGNKESSTTDKAKDKKDIHFQLPQNTTLQTQQQLKHLNKLNQYKKKLTFTQKLKSLKNSILDKNNAKSYHILKELIQLNCKQPIQVQIIFCKLLLENARSRHALTILERMLYYLNQVPQSQIYFYFEIALMAGILYFNRYAYLKALKSFQKALSILVKLSHYSVKMICVYNNIACVNFVMKNYQKCMLYLHRGFRISEYSVDYEYLMRSNMAMTLAEMGKIKQAKIQMSKINKVVEPVNNMVVFCKFYSNLAYLELIDSSDSRSLQKAINNFQQACHIQEKYLIPNGYRPSIFLHNNIAMLHYKRKQFKKAKFHSEKILNQLNDVNGMVGIRVHFNIGKIFSQGYNYDLPLKHFHEARILINKIDENKQPSVKIYKERINKEIEELERMRIQEVSQEESHKFSYMSSSLLKKV